MPPAAHAPASERDRRVPRSARERTANRRAGWGRERSTAIRKTGRWREPRDAFDPYAAPQARARSGVTERLKQLCGMGMRVCVCDQKERASVDRECWYIYFMPSSSVSDTAALVNN